MERDRSQSPFARAPARLPYRSAFSHRPSATIVEKSKFAIAPDRIPPPPPTVVARSSTPPSKSPPVTAVARNPALSKPRDQSPVSTTSAKAVLDDLPAEVAQLLEKVYQHKLRRNDEILAEFQDRVRIAESNAIVEKRNRTEFEMQLRKAMDQQRRNSALIHQATWLLSHPDDSTQRVIASDAFRTSALAYVTDALDQLHSAMMALHRSEDPRSDMVDCEQTLTQLYELCDGGSQSPPPRVLPQSISPPSRTKSRSKVPPSPLPLPQRDDDDVALRRKSDASSPADRSSPLSDVVSPRLSAVATGERIQMQMAQKQQEFELQYQQQQKMLVSQRDQLQQMRREMQLGAQKQAQHRRQQARTFASAPSSAASAVHSHMNGSMESPATSPSQQQQPQQQPQQPRASAKQPPPLRPLVPRRQSESSDASPSPAAAKSVSRPKPTPQQLRAKLTAPKGQLDFSAVPQMAILRGGSALPPSAVNATAAMDSSTSGIDDAVDSTVQSPRSTISAQSDDGSQTPRSGIGLDDTDSSRAATDSPLSTHVVTINPLQSRMRKASSRSPSPAPRGKVLADPAAMFIPTSKTSTSISATAATVTTTASAAATGTTKPASVTSLSRSDSQTSVGSSATTGSVRSQPPPIPAKLSLQTSDPAFVPRPAAPLTALAALTGGLVSTPSATRGADRPVPSDVSSAVPSRAPPPPPVQLPAAATNAVPKQPPAVSQTTVPPQPAAQQTPTGSNSTQPAPILRQGSMKQPPPVPQTKPQSPQQLVSSPVEQPSASAPASAQQPVVQRQDSMKPPPPVPTRKPSVRQMLESAGVSATADAAAGGDIVPPPVPPKPVVPVVAAARDASPPRWKNVDLPRHESVAYVGQLPMTVVLPPTPGRTTAPSSPVSVPKSPVVVQQPTATQSVVRQSSQSPVPASVTQSSAVEPVTAAAGSPQQSAQRRAPPPPLMAFGLSGATESQPKPIAPSTQSSPYVQPIVQAAAVTAVPQLEQPVQTPAAVDTWHETDDTWQAEPIEGGDSAVTHEQLSAESDSEPQPERDGEQIADSHQSDDAEWNYVSPNEQSTQSVDTSTSHLVNDSSEQPDATDVSAAVATTPDLVAQDISSRQDTCQAGLGDDTDEEVQQPETGSTDDSAQQQQQKPLFNRQGSLAAVLSERGVRYNDLPQEERMRIIRQHTQELKPRVMIETRVGELGQFVPDAVPIAEPVRRPSITSGVSSGSPSTAPVSAGPPVDTLLSLAPTSVTATSDAAPATQTAATAAVDADIDVVLPSRKRSLTKVRIAPAEADEEDESVEHSHRGGIVALPVVGGKTEPPVLQRRGRTMSMPSRPQGPPPVSAALLASLNGPSAALSDEIPAPRQRTETYSNPLFRRR